MKFTRLLLLSSSLVWYACGPGTGNQVPLPAAFDVAGTDVTDAAADVLADSATDLGSDTETDAVLDSLEVGPDSMPDGADGTGDGSQTDVGIDTGTDVVIDVAPPFVPGFASAPLTWAVPDARFGSLGGSAQLQGDDWATIDMNGDGLPDLVWSGDYTAHSDVGSNWRVYLGEGTGFAPSPVTWAVPDARFGSLAGSVQLQGDDWATVDMNGDGLPDLVWSGKFTAHADAGANWRVYLGDGTSFAASPVTWAVPDGRFGSLAGSSQLQGDDWATYDMNGDGRPDLVWSGKFTAHSDNGPNWRVYLSDGTSFAAAPVTWAVPDARFGSLSGSAQLQGDDWATIDMNGDGLPDLVWSGDYTAHSDLGSNWRIYLSGGNGFGSSPMTWAVPDARFGSLSGSAQLQGDDWATIDMNADGLPDLVWSGDYIAHADVGSNWRVYLSTDDGFASAPVTWAVPDARFGSLSGSAQLQGDDWATIDMSGDGLVDLVWSGDFTAHSDVGSNWRVYLSGQ